MLMVYDEKMLILYKIFLPLLWSFIFLVMSVHVWLDFQNTYKVIYLFKKPNVPEQQQQPEFTPSTQAELPPTQAMELVPLHQTEQVLTQQSPLHMVSTGESSCSELPLSPISQDNNEDHHKQQHSDMETDILEDNSSAAPSVMSDSPSRSPPVLERQDMEISRNEEELASNFATKAPSQWTVSTIKLAIQYICDSRIG